MKMQSYRSHSKDTHTHIEYSTHTYTLYTKKQKIERRGHSRVQHIHKHTQTYIEERN